MRLCTLNPSYERSDSPFRGLDPTADPSRYLPEASWEQAAIEKATAARQVADLSRQGFDAFVNLCDGAWDEDRAGVEVVTTLERFEQAFTGADSRFYEPTREVQKRVCHYYGIATPRYRFMDQGTDVVTAAEGLRYPLIVKHPCSYGSIGMGRDALVHDVRALAERVERMVTSYGEALVEEFIAGREFTVLVSEPGAGERAPRVYTPAECSFPPGESFKHFDLKWVDYEGLTWGPVRDDALAERLAQASRRLFGGLCGVGYGRCDLRMDAAGTIYMLEINPNCSIFYPDGAFGSADMILSYEDRGHRRFLEHIIECGCRRQRKKRRLWAVRPGPSGYHMVAASAIGDGQCIDAGEERPQHLVSRRHVEAVFDTEQRSWIAQYAWPLSDNLYAMWSDQPEQWKPIDHSCDPNAWLVGLDLVARRPIAAGEPITMDYATFCGPEMADFVCHCQTASCRQLIRGTDHLQGWVAERYGDHVSDYVRMRRG